jgi:hypothetical protein
MTRIGQGIAAGVAQHVSMDPERQLGALANGFHEAVDGVRRERTPALSLEDERTRRIPLQLAQHPQFITPDRVNCGLTVLCPTDVQRRIATPFDLRPFQVGDFDGPQTVAKGHEDQCGVAVAVAPKLRGRDQLLDLVRRQVFAGAHLSIRPSCRHFPKNVVRLDHPQVRRHKHFPPPQ